MPATLHICAGRLMADCLSIMPEWTARHETTVHLLGLTGSDRDLFDLAPHPEQITAPDFRDLFFRVAPADELERHVEALGRAVPPVHASAAVEIGRDSDVVDANQLYGVVDVVHVILNGGATGGRPLPIDCAMRRSNSARRSAARVRGRAPANRDHLGTRGALSAFDRAR